MRIKVIKSERETYWYFKLIGKVFEVMDENEKGYLVYKEKNTEEKAEYYIAKEDAEIVTTS